MNPIVTEPLVSVVVTTRNEERNIENMIKFINHHINNRTKNLDYNYKIVKNVTGNKLKKVKKTKATRKNRKTRKN
jgi:hypothetical protein